MHLPVARKNNSGGAIAMWRVAAALRDRGVDVRVSAEKASASKAFGFRLGSFASEIRHADVMLTAAGDATKTARVKARMCGVPVVTFVHSAATPAWFPSASAAPGLVVWGSASLRARVTARDGGWRGASMVMWPLIDADAVRVPAPGDRVTLVNLIPNKGVGLFWQIVEKMPHVKFLGVRGGWHAKKQVVPSVIPPNAEVAPFSPDPRRFYERTRVLLYMRGENSGPDWLNGVGMAAMEAAVSGIPTIAHPGPGLMESMGDAGTWCDSDDPADWCHAIDRMLQADVYAERSDTAAAHMAALDQGASVDDLLGRMHQLAGRKVAA